MHVGFTVLLGGIREVWASLAPGFSGGVLCDSPRRAHIILQILIDRRGNSAHGDLLVRETDDLNQIDACLSKIPPGTHKERLSSVYDVLVDEIRGETDDYEL
jgi:hypothetical protein